MRQCVDRRQPREPGPEPVRAGCDRVRFAFLPALLLGLAGGAPASAAEGPEPRLEVLGDPSIEPGNNYSENTRLRIRLVHPAGHPQAGSPVPGPGTPVTVEEWSTQIYDGRHGATRLPLTLEVRDGEAELTLRSLARYRMYDLRNMPVPKVVVRVAGRSADVLVPQWVDVDGNDKTDWLEYRVEDILRRARESRVPEIAEAARTLRSWDQSFKRDCGGFEQERPRAIAVSPACLDWDGTNAHRLNTNYELSATILHELRHVWVHQNAARHPDKRRLLKAPPGRPVGLIVPCPYLGPDGKTCAEHVWVQDPRYVAEEADAEAYAEQYKHLFP